MKVELPPHMPSAMSRLPRDEVGRPVPKFVGKLDGKYDFRVASADWLLEATARKLCFTCGEKLRLANNFDRSGLDAMFVVGPMCVVNCTSAEPPHHPQCGEWSVLACPFMNNPNRVRREAGLPHSLAEGSPGHAIDRNPGVTALVRAHHWTVSIHERGLLYHFEPVAVGWMTRGREATADEVLESIEGGVPALTEMCQLQLDEEGVDTFAPLAASIHRCLTWLPGAVDVTPYPNIMAALEKA